MKKKPDPDRRVFIDGPKLKGSYFLDLKGREPDPADPFQSLTPEEILLYVQDSLIVELERGLLVDWDLFCNYARDDGANLLCNSTWGEVWGDCTVTFVVMLENLSEFPKARADRLARELLRGGCYRSSAPGVLPSSWVLYTSDCEVLVIWRKPGEYAAWIRPSPPGQYARNVDGSRRTVDGRVPLS